MAYFLSRWISLSVFGATSTRYTPVIVSKLDQSAASLSGDVRGRHCHGCLGIGCKVCCPGKLCTVNDWYGRGCWFQRGQRNFAFRKGSRSSVTSCVSPFCRGNYRLFRGFAAFRGCNRALWVFALHFRGGRTFSLGFSFRLGRRFLVSLSFWRGNFPFRWGNGFVLICFRSCFR